MLKLDDSLYQEGVYKEFQDPNNTVHINDIDLCVLL